MIAWSKLLSQSGLKCSGLIRNASSIKNLSKKCVVISNQKSLLKLYTNLNKNSVIYVSNTSYDSNNSNKSFRNVFIAFIGIIGVSWYKLNENKTYCEDLKAEPESKIQAGEHIPSLPTYTDEELKKHNQNSDRIWVSFKNGIYDITDFIPLHPGGKAILAGAGTSIEPFWKIYAVHHSDETYELLEEYRIGNLKFEAKKVVENDPYSGDPARSPLLTVLTIKPFNAETPKEFSVESIITPNELHFKRNHLPVPHVDLEKFELEVIDDLNKQTYKFKLDDLKNKYPIYTIPVTIQCTGNRRKSMNDYEPVQGLMWDFNGISTAEWTGVKLIDLLADCNIKFDDERIQHVQFEGLDKDPLGVCYGASVPKEKVFDKNGDVLIAFQMNGVDIPLDHGFPLRVIVPGIVGARSVKWLNKVIISDTESKSHWQKNDYKVLPSSIKSLKDVDFSNYKPVQESPVQSAICQPVNGSVIDKENESFKIKGYAFSGGGKEIDSVAISIDGGETWQTAQLNQFKRPLNKSWSWAIWEYELQIPKEKTSLDIICVASDSSHNTQPESCKHIWNARGLMNNAWHKIHVDLK